jgi:peptide/nickel transport system substrate-binding protein
MMLQSGWNGVKQFARSGLHAVLFAVALGGCREAPPPADALVLALPSDPSSLDPRFASDANATRLVGLMHVGLTRADATARRVPELAAGWEMQDETTVIFHLRPGFRFPDGTPVTAADVKATYEAVLDPALASPKRAALAMLSSIEAPDPRTVVMRLSGASAPFLDATGLAVLPAGRAGDVAEVPPGAGPFRLAGAQRGDRIVLVPNPAYPGPPPRVGPLIVRIVPDGLVRSLELARGGVQFVQEPPEPEMLDWLAHVPDLVVRRGPGSSFAYLAVNFRDPRLRNPRVREAISLALDRQGLIRFVLGGAARPATGLLAPEHWAYAAVPPPRYDPGRARRLLDRAGYPDPDGAAGPLPRFRLVYKTSTDPGRRRLAEAMQAELAAVGIALDVRTYEWGTLYADIRGGNFELAALAWVGVGDPDLYHLALHSTMRPPAGYNRGGYTSRVMDRLTLSGRRTLTPARRRAIYARIQRRAARELPVVPLWWEDRVVVHSRRLRDFEPAADGDLRGLARAWME